MLIINNQSTHCGSPVPVTPQVEGKNNIRDFFEFFSLQSGFTFGQCPIKSQAVYRLRHKIYCQQLGYEPPNEKRMEKDDFDHRSSYVAVSHRPTENMLSCARVVCCHKNSDYLPFEELCEGNLEDSHFHPDNFDRQRICEISRFLVDKESISRHSTPWDNLIKFFLLSASVKTALLAECQHAYMLCEPKLIRYMKLVGVDIIPIGKYVAFHGLRQPCYINIEQFMSNTTPQWLAINQCVEHNMQDISSGSLVEFA